MRVCVYCGSSPGEDPRFVAEATAFGAALAHAGIGLVYGGGRVGLMGAVADGALATGGEVVGIIPRFLQEREIAHPDPRVDLRVVDSMHERKALMAELSDAFVALPGGFGTFEEFFEIVTWVQLGLADAPCILANVGGFYDGALAQIDGAHRAGFISRGNRAIVEVSATLSEVVEHLAARATGERAPRA